MASVSQDDRPLEERLAKFAVKVRKSNEQNWNCPQDVYIEEPIFGSGNTIYVVDLDDGTRWLFKIPVNGTRDKWAAMDSRALRSEAMTMTTIKDNTTIPVPKVFGFNGGCNNELGTPYILMEYIDGVPLHSVWFDKTQPPEVLHARRTRCLEQLADAMVQLGKFTSTRGGAEIYDRNLEHSVVGSLRVPDRAAMSEDLHDETRDDSPIYVEVGPFANTEMFYTALLNRQEEPQSSEGSTDFDKGLQILLRMFLGWILEPREPAYRYPPFVLAHPDLDIENIIVAEDGSLKGIIDWEGVGLVPRSIGNEQYPTWLTLDWNPFVYGACEDSPKTLKRYRAIYAECMESHYSPSRQAARFYLTRNSLVCQNLFLAATHPDFVYGVLEKILREIENVVRNGLLNEDGDSSDEEDSDAQVTFDLYDVAWALHDDKLGGRKMHLLMEGFDYLLSGKEVL